MGGSERGIGCVKQRADGRAGTRMQAIRKRSEAKRWGRRWRMESLAGRGQGGWQKACEGGGCGAERRGAGWLFGLPWCLALSLSLTCTHLVFLGSPHPTRRARRPSHPPQHHRVHPAPCVSTRAAIFSDPLHSLSLFSPTTRHSLSVHVCTY
ncbi:uncharacterized protein J3D65DRAFT_213519 [Phyllosticta citribraziliensis]|uniref:Uncharacterized protein n=1 Tax=Phyllosticta citribraziliensis TaxID=989973 RepID=A0ABR1M449_9PEZI